MRFRLELEFLSSCVKIAVKTIEKMGSFQRRGNLISNEKRLAAVSNKEKRIESQVRN